MGRLALLCLCLFGVMSCSAEQENNGRQIIVLWRHQVGDAEDAAVRAMIERFNQSQEEWTIEGQAVPQNTYSQSIVAASMADRLPCILTVDQPMVPTFVWSGHLRPLDDMMDETLFEEVAPAAVGRYQGRIYSVGQFDAALALYVHMEALEKVEARIPTIDEPWSFEEFNQILADLKATGDYPYVLDLSAGEANPNWWTYAFSPLLQSFGADLIDRQSMTTAEGVLNGPEAIAWAQWFHGLFEGGLVSRREPDDRAFLNKRVAMTYTGNWWAPEFSRVLGDSFLILPPPDLGRGTVIGGGSWQWGISQDCDQPEAAAAFIEHLMSADEIAAMANAAGMIPVTEAAAEKSEKFHKDGDWRIFFDLMQRYAHPRPATPAFTAVSNAFYRNARDIMDGKNPQDALDDAVDDIERNIADNDGYQLVIEEQAP